MRLVFFGTDDFAALHLQCLYDSRHDIAAVVTPPDRAQGRGLKISMCPVKEWAGRKGLTLFQPGDLKSPDVAAQLKNFNADVFVVIAYGHFLPSEILAIPREMAINVHASLLPKYRGAAPINWAVIQGEKETGISVIKMNERMDAGDIIVQSGISILPDETAVTLRYRLAAKGGECLLRALDGIEKGDYNLAVQDEGRVTYAPKLTKQLGLIDWTRSAAEIDRRVRGLLPWPAAYTFFEGKMLKILKANTVSGIIPQPVNPGEILDTPAGGILVAAGQDGLLLTRVHLESSREMDAASFILGHGVKRGLRLGKT